MLAAFLISLPCLAQQIVSLDDHRVPDSLLKILSSLPVDSIGKNHPITGTATIQDSLGESRDTYSWKLYIDPAGHLRGDIRLVTTDSVRGTKTTVTTRKKFNMDADLIICCKTAPRHCSTFRKYKKEYPDCREWQIQTSRKVQ